MAVLSIVSAQLDGLWKLLQKNKCLLVQQHGKHLISVRDTESLDKVNVFQADSETHSL